MAIQHLTQQLLAKRWNVSIRTLERWRAEGIGPVYLKIHGRVSYRETDIEKFESGCMHESTSTKFIAYRSPVTCDV